MSDSRNVHRLNYEDKEILLLGTAHVSRDSVEEVQRVIEEERPDTVCVELCESRYQSLKDKNAWQNMDLLKAVRTRKASLLLLNLLLAHFQRKIGNKLGVKPGEEMMRAVEAADGVGAELSLADRDIRTTLSRTWRLMSWWTRIKLFAQVVMSAGRVEEIDETEIENMKKEDVLQTLLSEVGESLPELRRVLIDERDLYLAHRIRTAPGKKIVAVVGAGHVPGIMENWEEAVDVEGLSTIPKANSFWPWFKWILPLSLIGLFAYGFWTAGAVTGAQMLKWWIVVNAVLAGAGAALALAHPLTIVSAVVASPFTSLNPMIAAGWVSGCVETLMGRPKVKDFENLTEDITSLRGFWKNKITRVLLVVVFTNLGSLAGTVVAIPLIVKGIA
jgi:pheromone shutdown-related protein TraB